MTQASLFGDPETNGLDYRVHPSGAPNVHYSYQKDPGGQSGVVSPTDFQFLARDAVAEYYNQFLRPATNELRDPAILPEEVFVVWFVKVLQNWKALCSTIVADDRYFELTYNGDKHELYIDEYVKKGNQVFVRDIPSQRTSGEHC